MLGKGHHFEWRVPSLVNITSWSGHRRRPPRTIARGESALGEFITLRGGIARQTADKAKASSSD